ncbi:MAG: translocation/assembly module TamB domain-containing protein [Pseudanabaenaceae cyanobacterium]
MDTPTPSPKSGTEPSPPPRRRWGRWVALGSLTTLGLGLGGLWYGRYWLQREFSPWLAAELSKSLQRPVQLGPVERLTWRGVRFGPSVVPPTAQEANFLVAKALEVQVDFWQYRRDRTIRLDVVAEQPHGYLEQNAVTGSFLPALGPPAAKRGLIDLQTVRLRQGSVTLRPLQGKPIALRNLTVDSQWQTLDPVQQRVTGTVRGQVVLPELAAGVPNPQTLTQAIAAGAAQGELSAQVDWDLTVGQGTVTVEGKKLGVAIARNWLPDLPLQQGAGAAAAQLRFGAGGQLQQITGEGSLQNGLARGPNIPQPLSQVAGKGRFSWRQGIWEAVLTQGEGRYGAIALTATGTYRSDRGLDVTLQTPAIDVGTWLQEAKAVPPVALSGLVQVTATLRGQTPELKATVQSTGPLQVERFMLSGFQAQVSSQNFQVFALQGVQAQGERGGEAIANGEIRLTGETPELFLAGRVRDLPAEAYAAVLGTALPVPVGNLNAAVQVTGAANQLQITSQVEAPAALYPTRADLRLAEDTVEVLQAEVRSPVGTVAIRGQYNLRQGTWQATADSQGLPLQALVPQGRGTVIGQANLQSRGGFAPEAIAAQVNFALPAGLSLDGREIPEAIAGQLTWDGTNLRLVEGRVGDLVRAQGTLDLVWGASPSLTGVDVRVTGAAPLADWRRLLPQLPAAIAGRGTFAGQISGAPTNLQVRGQTTVAGVEVGKVIPQGQGTLAFHGEVSGPVADPQVQGTVTLANGRVDRLTLPPRLTGPLRWDGQGLQFDLTGEGDRLQGAFNRDFTPQTLTAKLGTAELSLTPEGNGQRAIARGVPLALLGAIVGQNHVRGQANADLRVVWGPNLQAEGTITVQQPQLGRIRAERLQAQLTYQNGRFRLEEGTLALGRGEAAGAYGFAIAFDPQNPAQTTATITAKGGQLQDVVALMQWVEPRDIGRGWGDWAPAAALVPPVALGLAAGSLYRQLEYFAQVQARIEQDEVAAAQANLNLPPLRLLQGRFDGTLSLRPGDRRPILAADIRGENWEYGKFAVDRVILKGEYRGERLFLETLEAVQGERLGRLADAQLSLGILTSDASPLERLRYLQETQKGRIQLQDFPLATLRPFPFFANLPFDIDGDVSGEVTLGGTVALPEAEGRFRIANGSFDRQNVKSAEADFRLKNLQIQFKGQVLVAGEEPIVLSGTYPLMGDALDVNIAVKDEGLAFINILNQPVRWQGGQGQGNLTLSGTRRSPQVRGRIDLKDAEFRVVGLPAAIEQVSGFIEFGLTELLASLTGKFSDGDLKAEGRLPTIEGAQAVENPLTFSAEKLNLDLKDLYQGGAQGTVAVTGSLRSPILSGEVILSDGRILLTEPSGRGENGGAAPDNLRLEGLLVKLAERVQISRAPLLNFVAQGEISVSGTPRNLQPSGRIDLVGGQFNAISARFRLDRSFENFATFQPALGLNPTLNVRVTGVVPEVTRVPLPTNPLDAFNTSTNVPVTAPGAQRSLQVQATVTGTASNPDIQLSSSPPRSQAEILTLIGGGLLQQQSDAAAAIANLAGSTFIGFLQDAIGDVFNLSEFNLTPTTNNPVGGRSSGLALSAEGAIDIGRQFSISVRGVLNDPAQPTTYTLRYRLDPNTLVRTSTDLQGNTSASVEYETRF